jgi:hypothetical protein
MTMNPEWKDLSLEWQVEKISPVGRNDKLDLSVISKEPSSERSEEAGD